MFWVLLLHQLNIIHKLKQKMIKAKIDKIIKLRNNNNKEINNKKEEERKNNNNKRLRKIIIILNRII